MIREYLPLLIEIESLAVLAALAVLIHVHLAFARGWDHGRFFAALLVPGIGPVRSWTAGKRVAPVLYAIVLVAYVVLRIRT